ncbi:PIN domain-containing protein, partial [Salinibacter ruber]|uniref:PIN domain-containing protein n=1 Tax=Salinibacter ruber TaxID=146919 RepID=UPI002167DEC6
VSLFDHRIDQAGGPDATQFKQKDSLLVEPLPDFLQARRWMAQRSTALRTLDALHLATANRHELRVLTADRIMNRAGRHLDLPVERLREE